ncbi:hypothetical protein Tco_1545816 [Tanacetum coccineum]
MKAIKKSRMQKTDSDLEEEEEHLKTFLKLVPDEEGTIDYENQERWNLKSWNFYENYGVHTLTLEDGTEIHMLAERKYPLTKRKTLIDEYGWNLLWSEIGSLSVGFITHNKWSHSPFNRTSRTGLVKANDFCKSWLLVKVTALGKDISNPLIVDSLLKTIWLSMHPCFAMKHGLWKWENITMDFVTKLPKTLSGQDKIWVMLKVLAMKGVIDSGKDEPLAIPLDEIQIDDKLNFIEEPVEIMDREVKRLKKSCIPIVKVRWNSRRGPELTWEREDQMKKKYPHFFVNPSSTS